MNLKKALTPDTIRVHVDVSSKKEVIDTLLNVIAEGTGKVHDKDTALSDLLAREEKMSTGMQAGIAIPHAKTEAVDELVAGLLISKEPVDFQALDGNPCSIFIMTLSPTSRKGPHLQFIAAISQILKTEEVRKKLLAAGSSEEIFNILTENS